MTQPLPRTALRFKQIRLELARTKDFPSGSTRHGYEFVAPLDANGHIDAGMWGKHKAECRVSRFWGDEEDQLGHLVHKPGSGEHAFWAFDYDPRSSDDDEPGYRFGAHKFTIGEYVTVSGNDGEQHTFRVASVRDAK